MKRNKIIKTIKFKVISLLLSISIMTGMPFSGMVQPVSAATNQTVATTSTTTGTPSSATPKSTDLQTNNNQDAQVLKGGLQALGLSTEQPSKTDAAGKVIDKNTNNPLGANSLGFNRTMQLATAGVGNNANELYDIYDKPLGASSPDYSKPLLGTDGLNIGSPKDLMMDWRRAPKAIVAADLNGTGKDTVVTAAIPAIDNNNVKLELIVTDYNEGKAIEKELVVVSSLLKPMGYTDSVQYPIHAAAGDFDHDGKDEVAIVVGRTLYICKADQTSASILSQITFDENSAVAKIMNTSSDLPRIDVKSGDVDKDGYKELLVTTGSSNGGATYTPKLLIYHGTDATQPVANLELKVNNSLIFRSANVAVGDLLGDGVQAIVLGGWTTQNTTPITYIKYHASTKTTDAYYDTVGTNPLYNLSIPKVNGNLLTLNCVSLETPIPGQGQFVVFGDDIFKYDSQANNGKGDFVKHNVTNSAHGYGNITGTTYDVHWNMWNPDMHDATTYILNTIVGNFDGNTLGKEQILMLHYNNNYFNSASQEYITWCGEDSNGNIVDHRGQVWSGGQYNYPAICAPDVYANGTRLVYEKSEFTFSDPTVIAVLGATPFYKELTNQYLALGNVGTTYGTESSTENSDSKGVTARVGVSFGYDAEVSLFGVKVAETEFEVNVENSFTNTWSSSKSVSKSVAFTYYYSEDSVVVTTVPYDIYYYKMYDADHPEGVEININIPYVPETSIMPLSRYNSVAKNLKNAPVVGPEVLKHTVGDPRSYPQSSDGLSNVNSKGLVIGSDNVLTGSDEKGNSFIGAGIGNASSELSITTSNSTGKSFDYSLDVDVSLSVTLGAAKLGVSGGAGYSSNVTTTSSKSTTRTGSVSALPTGYENYNFQWGLVAYNYNLTKGNSTQECTVISYLVKPIHPLPPAVPDNFKVQEGSTSLTSTTLVWDKVSTATGYKISRAEAEDGPYSQVADLNGGDTTTYTDSDLVDANTYYYKVLAYSAYPGMDTDPLSITTFAVESLSVKTQPKLFYNQGDALDLSALQVTLHLSQDTTQDVGLADFATHNLAVNLTNGTPLDLSGTGTPLTITYAPGNKSVQTHNLVINAAGSKDLMVNITFKVGTKENATELAPNELLEADATVQNNQTTSQNVVLIVALYDDKGALVNMSTLSKDIAAGATENIHGGFQLPAKVTNYTAKAFAWDGTDITSSSQTPLSNSVQIPQ